MADQPYDPAFTLPVSGAINGGATCWGNALLQALMSVPQFMQACMEEKPTLGAAAEFYKHCAAELPLQKASPTAHTKFLDILCALEHQTGMGLHNSCADEGIVLLLDQFSDVTQQLFHHAYMWRMCCPLCSENKMEKRDVDTILKIHPVLNMSERDVTLYNRKLRELPVGNPMRDHTFIPQFQTADDMSRWIRAHGDITDEFKCDKCDKKVLNLPRAASLVRLNACLIIRLDRVYGGDVCNWFHELSFPAIADGVKYQRKYKLCAVIKWSGGVQIGVGANGGHYWAKVLRRDQWYIVNDAVCEPCAPPTPNPSTLILMYSLA
jgi:Ubiquitin carboxyl-terminal hydrolase